MTKKLHKTLVPVIALVLTLLPMGLPAVEAATVDAATITGASWSWQGRWEGGILDITDLTQTGNTVTGTAFRWDVEELKKGNMVKSNDATATYSGTVSGGTLSGTYTSRNIWESFSRSGTFTLTMTASGEWAIGTYQQTSPQPGGVVILVIKRREHIYGVFNCIPSQKTMKDGALFTGLTGTAGKFSWEGAWKGTDGTNLWNSDTVYLKQSGHQITGDIGSPYFTDMDVPIRAYAFGNTLTGTMEVCGGGYTGYNYRDFKMTMNANGTSATCTMNTVGGDENGKERKVTFTKLPEYGQVKAKSIAWSKTPIRSFTGTWNLINFMIPDGYGGHKYADKTKIKLKYETGGKVTGTINGNSANTIQGAVVGRNLYGAYKLDGKFFHFWARMSADGKDLKIHSGLSGVSGGGGEGWREGSKKKLDKPTGLMLNLVGWVKTASWAGVTNNSGYTLKVLQGKKQVLKINIKKDNTSHTFTKKQLKKLKKKKKYSFTLVAKGKGRYANSKVAKSKAVKMK